MVPSSSSALVRAQPTESPPLGESDHGGPVPGYALLGVLGEGGSATVYEAEHLRLRKRVAIKLVSPRFASDPVLVERTRVEAQALALLRSPHLVEVYDHGQTSDGSPYYVMELVRGRSLSQELSVRGCLPVDEAVAWARQLLAGLSTVHAAGLVHRDVKLSNLLLAETLKGTRTLKIVDLGITKVLPEAAGPVPSALPTEEGVVVGTPRFLSPEQAEGRPVDARTDIYNAGLVLYQLLTGVDPFHYVRGIEALLEAHASEVPRPPSTVAPQRIPSALDRLVLRALAKRPEDRWASADEFSMALAVLAKRHDAPPPWGLGLAIVLTSAVLSVLLAAALGRGW